MIPVPAWMGGRGGRPEGYCHREMIDAITHLVDSGTKWRALPIDFPAWTAVCRFFRRWRDQGLLVVWQERLRGGSSGSMKTAGATRVRTCALRGWRPWCC